MEDGISAALQAQAQQPLAWMQSASFAAACVCVLLLAVLIVLLLRMRARNRKIEAWLTRELTAMQDRQEHTRRAVEEVAASLRKRPQKPLHSADARQEAHVQAQQKPARAPVDLLATVNEMLAGNQPYNMIEAVRAIEPRLHLQRMSPYAGEDPFAKDVMLEPGGDGLFACIDGDSAQLYPNYSRFSATLDPKPLFDGARHGGRIHSVLAPAQLRRAQDGTWLLAQRGRVQMRQGK